MSLSEATAKPACTFPGGGGDELVDITHSQEMGAGWDGLVDIAHSQEMGSCSNCCRPPGFIGLLPCGHSSAGPTSEGTKRVEAA